jgi:RNA polymerase sigma factor (sigma-70 family)
MVNMYNDRELVDKILNENKSAFSILVKKYERMVWFLVSRMVLDEDETKDICQEAFIKVYLNLDKFNFESKLSTWIATVTYRLTLNYLKKK